MSSLNGDAEMNAGFAMLGPPLISLLSGIAILLWPRLLELYRGVLPDTVRVGGSSAAGYAIRRIGAGNHVVVAHEARI
jgi:hypothetical protein